MQRIGHTVAVFLKNSILVKLQTARPVKISTKKVDIPCAGRTIKIVLTYFMLLGLITGQDLPEKYTGCIAA